MMNIFQLLSSLLRETNKKVTFDWGSKFPIQKIQVVGRHHPSLYPFSAEIQKEAGDTEGMLRQIYLGQKN